MAADGSITIDTKIDASSFQSGMSTIDKSAKTALGSFGTGAQKAGKKISDAGKKMLPATVAIGGVGTAAVKTASDFETSMSQTAGALNVPMSKMGGLRDLAMDMGAKTQFSATEAGNAMTELAKGGLTEAEIQSGALKSTMDLAASSGMGLGDAANTVVQAMGGFGLSAKDSAQAVNALAGAAAASSTDVGPLADALSQCAAQAHTAGWSIQDTTAVLGEFADAGVTSSDAGTSLKTMLQRLAAPTGAAAKEMKTLGINVWDSSGHMKDAGGISQELQSKLGGLSDQQKQQALATIFGSDATRAATILMDGGAKGLSKYTKATNDQTSAQRLANSQMGPTQKAWENMKGSLETAAISIGTMLLPMVQKLTGFIKGLADNFAALNPQQQKIVLTILGIVAVVGPLLVLIGKVTMGIGAIAVGVSKLIGGIKLLGGGIAALFALVAANPIILIIAGVAALIAVIVHLWQTNEGFRNAVIEIWTAIAGFFQTVGAAIAGFFTAAWGVIQTVWGAAAGFFSGVWQGIQSVFSAVGPWFASVFGTAWSGVQSIWSAATGFFSGVWNGITRIFSVVGGWFSSVFGTAWTGVKNIWSAATGWFQGVWNGIKGAFKPNMISDAFGRAWGAIKGAWGGAAGWFQGIWNGISSGFRGAINAIIKGMNWLIRGLNKIHFNVPGWVPGAGGKSFGINIGEIPLLAKGGVIDEATLAMLGEHGKEAVVPLERNTGWIRSLSKELISEVLNQQRRAGEFSKIGTSYFTPALATAGAPTYNQTVNNYSPKALSPAESARLTRNSTRQLLLSVKKR